METREYDDLNRLEYIETSGPEGVIASFRYTLDDTGNRTQVVEHDGRRVEYEYDDLYRLTAEIIFDPGAVGPSRIIEYTYDTVGNRLSRTDTGEGTTLYIYDDNDRLLTATTDGVATTYTYDNNGNTTSKTSDGTTIAYTWNADNRLIGADTDGDGAIDVVNQYNENGIRVSQTVNGEETRFLIDANRDYSQVLEEYTPGGIVKVSYVYGNDLISQNRGGEKSFYHVDGLGSTRALSDEAAFRSDQYIYDAFGQVIKTTGDTENLYLFAGEQRSSIINLDYLRARYLDPEIGRFNSRDQFEGFSFAPISQNKYIYAEANPFNNIDPSGLFVSSSLTETIITSAIIAAIAPVSFLKAGLIFSGISGGGVIESKAKITIVDAIGIVSGAGVTLPLGASGIVLELETREGVRARNGNIFRGTWLIGLVDTGINVGSPQLESVGTFKTPSIFFDFSPLVGLAAQGPATFWDISLGRSSITAAFVGSSFGVFDGVFLNEGAQFGATLSVGWSQLISVS